MRFNKNKMFKLLVCVLVVILFGMVLLKTSGIRDISLADFFEGI